MRGLQRLPLQQFRAVIPIHRIIGGHNAHCSSCTTTSKLEVGGASGPGSPYTKRRALVTFGFCGTAYCGLQEQRDQDPTARPTVSRVLRVALRDSGAISERNFETLEHIQWRIASRTDKGVHATCAAASCKLETLDEHLIYDDEVGNYGQRGWRFSDEAVARINELLPADVRVFSVTRVKRSFDARLHASSRTYEYVLPLSLLDGASPTDLDAVLRTFEGTHSFHNFASGEHRQVNMSRGSWLCSAADSKQLEVAAVAHALTWYAYSFQACTSLTTTVHSQPIYAVLGLRTSEVSTYEAGGESWPIAIKSGS